MPGLAAPIASDQAAAPASTLRTDKRLVLLSTLLLAVAFGSTFACVFSTISWFISLVSDSSGSGVLSLTVLGAILGGLIGIFSGRWPYYLITRVWAGCHGTSWTSCTTPTCWEYCVR